MGAAILITLREGLEAALIVSIILAFISRLGRQDQFRSVWLGTGVAVGVSLVVGGGVFWTVGELSGRAEQIYEGTAMLIAVAVLSYMVLWMRKQARFLKAQLEAQVKSALQTGSTFAMAFLAFVVVVREGIESVFFLFQRLAGGGECSSAVPGRIHRTGGRHRHRLSRL